jgi:autotransporter-associated beta strand protein
MRSVRTAAALAWAASVVVLSAPGFAQTFSVTNAADSGAGSLRQAILNANAYGGNATININAGVGTIRLASALPILSNPNGTRINGNGNTLDANGVTRGLFLGVTAGETAGSGLSATTAAEWVVGDLTIRNGWAQGGNGGGGGGGGAGLGGGIFVNAGSATLSNVSLRDNYAVGGDGTTSTGANAWGGGGGLGGDGRLGGGGFGPNTLPPPATYYTSANGHPGAFNGGASGGSASDTQASAEPGTVGGGNGGGGAGFMTGFYGLGGGGGVGGQPTYRVPGGPLVTGNGGFGGGGGASPFGGGAGGYGGGGGGGVGVSTGGNGGFGGGAGGALNTAGTPGFGGGAGRPGLNSSQGGGGAGLGGGVFVRAGASVNFTNSSVTGGGAWGGGGYGEGLGSGSALFLAGGATFNVTSGNTVTIGETIGGGFDSQIVGGLTKTGAGTLALTGDNSYTGGTNLNQGTLSIQYAANLGAEDNANPLYVNNNARLQFDGNPDVFRTVEIRGGGGEVRANQIGRLRNATLTGTLTKTGGQSLILNATGNGGVRVSEGDVRVLGGESWGSGAVTLDPGTGITAALGTATLANPISMPAAGERTVVMPFGTTTLNLNGAITGDGGLRFSSFNGNLARVGGAGANTYAGTTTVAVGTLELGKSAGGFDSNFGSAMGGDLLVSSGATARYAAWSQVRDDRSVSVAGTLNLNGNSDVILNLNLLGGSVSNAGANALYVNGSINANNSAASSSTSDINLNGVRPVTVDAGGVFTMSAAFAGGGVEKLGAGTLVLARPSTYVGATTVTAGTLALANGNGTPTLASPAVTVGAGATLRFDANDNFGNHSSAAGPDIVVNGGTVTNSGAYINALQNLTLNGGTLSAAGEFGGFGAFSVRRTLTSSGNSAINLGTNRLALGQDGDTTFDVTGGTLTVSSPIADNFDGPGALIKTGGGVLRLTAAGSYTGGTTINAGTVAIATPAALGGGGVRVNSATIRTDAAMTFARAVIIGDGQVALFDTNGFAVTLDGAVTGAAGFIKQGAGTLTLTNAGNGQYNNRVDAGTLAVAADAHLGIAGGTLFAVGGTLRVDGSFTSARPLVIQSGGSFAVDTNGNTLVWTGGVSGSQPGSALVKNGAGTLRLTGGGAYAGGTTVNAGTLELVGRPAGGSATGSGTVDVVAGALAGDGRAGGDVVVRGGASVVPGNPFGPLAVDGAFTLGDGSASRATLVARLDFAADRAGSVDAGNGVTLNAAALRFDLLNVTGGPIARTFILVNNRGNGPVNGTFADLPAQVAGAFEYTVNYAYAGPAVNGVGDGNDIAVTFTAVPEPGAVALLTLPAALLGRRRRRMGR